jgi:hypothetical protein
VELLKPLVAAGGQPGIAVAVSAQCTNEEAVGAFMLGSLLGASKYVLCGKTPGQGDDFLVRTDKNPNAHGVKLAAQAFGVKLEGPLALKGMKAVVAFRTDGLTAELLQSAEVLVAIAQNEDEATAKAQVTLPVKSVYEQEGSLVNYYGRLQHAWEAVQAQKADTAAGWVWAERLMTGLGSAASLTSPAAAFAQLAQRAPALKGLSLSDVGEEGVVLESLLPTEWPARAPRPGASR